MKIIEFTERIKIWWLAIALIAVSIISSNLFPSNTKVRKQLESYQDSMLKINDSIIAVRDGVIVDYNKVQGERDALAKQLDRNASQQIIINNKTTNITKKIIVRDTTK